MRETRDIFSCRLYDRFFKQQIIKVWFSYHKTTLHSHILFPNEDHMGESCFGMFIYQDPTAGCFMKNTATTACLLFVKQFIEVGGTNGSSIEIPAQVVLLSVIELSRNTEDDAYLQRITLILFLCYNRLFAVPIYIDHVGS